MQEHQELADNMRTLKIGLAIFFSGAHRVANEAIREQTELLKMEDGPTNLSELLNMMFAPERIKSTSKQRFQYISSPRFDKWYWWCN